MRENCFQARVLVFTPGSFPHQPVQQYQTFAHNADRALYSSYVRLLFLGLMPDWERRGACWHGEHVTNWQPKEAVWQGTWQA